MPLSKFAEQIRAARFALSMTVLAFALPIIQPAIAQDLTQPDIFASDEPAATGDGTAAEGGEAEQPQERPAAEVFEEAKQLADAGKYDEAIPLLSQILGVSPNFVPAAILRGQAFNEIGEPQLALESFALAVNYGIRFPEIYAEALGERGKVLLDLGNSEEAAADFALAVQSAPSNAEYLFLRGKAYAKLAIPNPAAFGGASGSPEYLRQAISSLTRAISIDPSYAEAYAERGGAYTISSRFEEALADLEKAMELDGDTPNYKANFGFISLRRAENERRRPNADKSQVIQDYQAAISAFDNFLGTEGNKTKADFEGEPIDIFRPNQAYLGRSSAQIGLANQSGGGADQRGRYSAAAADADKAFEFDETNASATFQKGIAQRLMGDLETAAQTFTDFLAIQPTFAEANIRRGICYYYLGDLDTARRDFEEATVIPDGRAQFWLGVTYAKEGDYESAVRQYSRSIRLNPQFKPAFSNRGLALMKLKQYRRATSDFNELLRRDRKDSVARQRRDQAQQLMRQ